MSPELSAFIQGLLMSSHPRSGFNNHRRPPRETKPRDEQEHATPPPVGQPDTSNVIPIRRGKEST